MSWRVIQGDCVEQMAAMPAGSVDAVVCDPPYGLGFMGKEWDSVAAIASRPPSADRAADPRTGKGPAAVAFDGIGFQAWCIDWAREALRVLKPGGHLLAFGGTRTYHRLAAGIEDAGFEIRDTICWLYGQGFPKSLNIGCKCGGGPVPYDHAEEAPERDVRPVRSTDVPASEHPRDERGEVLLAGVPELDIPTGRAVPAARSPRRAERVVEGRRDVLAEEGQLPADQVRQGDGVGAADGEGRRLPDGTSPAHGADGRAPADANGSGPSPRPRPDEQRADEPGAVAVEPAAQAGGAWPTCGRCGLPAAGLGTALKPAFEPIVVARKPLAGTVAGNVLAHGTGALNVDGCRVDMTPDDEAERAKGREAWSKSLKSGTVGNPGQHTSLAAAESGDSRVGKGMDPLPPGRWPANVVLDPDAAAILDDQTGDVGGNSGGVFHRKGGGSYRCAEDGSMTESNEGFGYQDAGGASRFFYVAKASSAERNAGLDGFEEQRIRTYEGGEIVSADHPGTANGGRATTRNVHPTVKPIELMRWLVRLVTPPGGTVLDPFTGSGTTGAAAVLEGFDFVGIEREAEYATIAEARIGWWEKHSGEGSTAEVLSAAVERHGVEGRGQLDLFGVPTDGEAA